MARKSTTQKASPAERRNWGYWDGKSARERGRFPDWAKAYVTRQAHPFDKPYGEAFWAGWYDEPHPNGDLMKKMFGEAA
jgi:hypothetical protein